MGVSLRKIAFPIMCFTFIGSFTEGTIPGGRLYYCDSDKQCHPRARCLFNLCTCQGYSYGDGKYKCEAFRPCPPLTLSAKFGCLSQHSLCLVKSPHRGAVKVCKCKDGYFGDPRKRCREAPPVGELSLCKNNGDCGYDNCVAGLCRCPENSIGNSDDSCEYGFEGACNGQGPCTKPGTVCFHTELYGIGWADKELCMCRGGLVGDPYTTGCHEPASQDLCHWYSGACPKHSRCKQYGNMFRCECDQGYSKNEWNECEDINECDDSSKCAHLSECTNFPGSFTCKCRDGFIGDGVLCERLPDRLINIAIGRPTEMQSTEGKYFPGKAVDGNRGGNLHKGSCARTTKFKDPWWRVDLGNSVWVEKVVIANRNDCCDQELSNVEIRIGNKKESNKPSNPICREGLQVPKDPWLYSCAEPMLGRYVYIRSLGKEPKVLTICEVEVYVDKTALLSYSKFLIPDMNGKLDKPSFVGYDQNNVVMKLGKGSTIKVQRQDIIIDLPPREENLKHSIPVFIPVTYDSYLINASATCERKEDSEFLNGKFVSEIYAKMKYAVNVTNNVLGRRKFKNRLFQCNKLTDLRIEGDICKLQVKCQKHSFCESKHVSISFPPGSYQCVCDDGYYSSRNRSGNVVAPGEHCTAKSPPEPKLKYSTQNLALNCRTSSSSADNFAGCKHKRCKEIPALAKFAVDGLYHKCYRSVSTYTPWLMIHLDGTHPIVSVQLDTSKEFDLKRTKVFVGYSGKRLSADNLCAAEDIPKGTVWNMGCFKVPLFGNIVKIQTSSSILALCEVEVYAEPYGNVAMRHAAIGSTNSGENGNPLATAATDGKYLIGTPPCFYSKYKNKASWEVDLGPNNRVAMVFIYLQKELADVHKWNGIKDIDIFVGNSSLRFYDSEGNKKSKDELCCHVSKPIMLGKYLECKQTLVGQFVKIKASKPEVALELCEVEVFPTRIVNLAGNRLTLSSSNGVHAYRGTDHKMDKTFKTSYFYESYEPWWSVDLMIKTKIRMIRIVTAIGYKRSDFDGLQLLVGESSPARRFIAKLKPTDETVQVITLTKITWAKVVTLRLYDRKNSILSFREVEVYNGQLIDVNECDVPDICPDKLKCVNLPISFTCECRDGYKPRPGSSQECLDVDECLDVKNTCPVKNTYCQNTVGLYKCICSPGFEPVYQGSNLLKCRDVDECSNPALYSCSTNNSVCVNEEGSYSCSCAKGYKKLRSREFRDQDIDCIDVDECKEASGLCHVNASCANSIGSYRCTCNFGTKGNGRVCETLDTCSDSKPCLGNKLCKAIKKIHFCLCEEGYIDMGKTCQDKDECALQEHNCGENSVCHNAEGGYKCSCESGFKSPTHDGRNCKDIDECKDTAKYCGNVADCQNNRGGYSCKCPRSGFVFDSKTLKCKDYDECAVPKSPCGVNEVCHNKVGSYECKCQGGYRYQQRNNSRICQDIDECSEGENECDRAAWCKNTVGGYVCNCKEGYRKTEGGKCEENCVEKCDENAYCLNGRCYCLPGYKHDPVTKRCYDSKELIDSSVPGRYSPVVLAASLLGYQAFAYIQLKVH